MTDKVLISIFGPGCRGGRECGTRKAEEIFFSLAACELCYLLDATQAVTNFNQAFVVCSDQVGELFFGREDAGVALAGPKRDEDSEQD